MDQQSPPSPVSGEGGCEDEVTTPTLSFIQIYNLQIKKEWEMKFTIIGAGNMGRGIATRLLSGGNQVALIDHDENEAIKLANELQAVARGGVSVSAVKEIPDDSEFVILAVYLPSIKPIIETYREQLAGKFLVDIANPLNATFDDMGLPPDTSSAEETAKIAPAGAKVIKAFNTTLSGTLLSGEVAGQPLDVLIAGDDAQAKAKLADAIRAGGLRPVDAGPLKRARQLEAVGFLQIVLQDELKSNWQSAVKFLP